MGAGVDEVVGFLDAQVAETVSGGAVCTSVAGPWSTASMASLIAPGPRVGRQPGGVVLDDLRWTSTGPQVPSSDRNLADYIDRATDHWPSSAAREDAITVRQGALPRGRDVRRGVSSSSVPRRSDWIAMVTGLEG